MNFSTLNQNWKKFVRVKKPNKEENEDWNPRIVLRT